MRLLLFAALTAAVPFGLYGHLAGSGGAEGVWLRIAVTGVAGVLILLGYRAWTGGLGPGLAAALMLCANPTITDAVASPYALSRLGMLCGATALVCLLMVVFRARDRAAANQLVNVLNIVFLGGISFLSDGADGEYGARAFSPFVLQALGWSMLAGQFASLASTREGGRPSRLWIAIVASGILASAVVAQVRAESWKDPVSFWERAAREVPRSPAALGALAGARAGAGDREGATAALVDFTEAVNGGAGKRAGEPARRAGADGAAAAARALLSTPGKARDAGIAESALRAAREFAPDNLPVRVALAEACLARGDFLEPIRLLEEAVGPTRPGTRTAADAPAFDALARALLAAGRVPEALDAARTATGLLPTEKRFIATWAEGLLAVGRGAEAIEILHGALASGPPYDPVVARAYAAAQLGLARDDVSLGRPGPARRKLLSAAQYDRSLPECAELLADLDRRMEAERPEMEKLLEKGPDGKVNANDWLLFTVWLCRWGDFESAEPHFRRMLELRGTTPAIHYWMGLEFWEGRGSVEGVEKAIASYQQAIALDPSYKDAWNRLWQCQRLLGRTEEARASARRFIGLAPDDPDAAAAQKFLEGK